MNYYFMLHRTHVTLTCTRKFSQGWMQPQSNRPLQRLELAALAGLEVK